jgi:hypothetical protein
MLPLPERDRLVALARSNERSTGAEIRIALREHLSRHAAVERLGGSQVDQDRALMDRLRSEEAAR